MSDNLKEIMFGKTREVKLADGKKYKMSELNIGDFLDLDSDFSDLTKPKNIFQLAYKMVKKNHPSLKDGEFKTLVLFPSMIMDTHPFMKAYMELMGVSQQNGADPNELAGKQSLGPK